MLKKFSSESDRKSSSTGLPKRIKNGILSDDDKNIDRGILSLLQVFFDFSFLFFVMIKDCRSILCTNVVTLSIKSGCRYAILHPRTCRFPTSSVHISLTSEHRRTLLCIYRKVD
jgi:hypothetical protein